MKIVKRTKPFIRQFAAPSQDNIICFKFWQAVIASGCPGACAYCFLQTHPPYRQGLYDLTGTLFENLRNIVPEVERWLQQSPPAGLLVGENQDGLAFEEPYKQQLGVTPLELLIPLFTEHNPVGHTLIVLSKFTSTQYAEAFSPSPHVVFSWSLSLPSISRDYEKNVAPLKERLAKAAQMKAEGYRIRFRLDALAPVPEWEDEVADLMEQINAIEPEMVTLGALRATNNNALRQAAEDNGRDTSLFDYIDIQEASGFRFHTNMQFHEQLFRMVKDQMNPSITLGLCKAERGVWQEMALPWAGCHCLHSSDDTIVETDLNELFSLHETPPPKRIQELTVYPVERIDVNKIDIPPNVRADWEHLDVLEASLRTNGQLQAIGVKPEGETFQLLWGHNRLRAARNLGWDKIRAEIRPYEDGDIQQELVVLEENLVRDDLNHLEYAEALGRMKAIYQRLYPATAHGKGQSKKDPESGSLETQRPAFIDDTSRQLGWSRSKLGQYLFVYSHLKAEVRGLIRTHEIVNEFQDLDHLAHQKPDLQQAVARQLHHDPHISYQNALWRANTGNDNDDTTSSSRSESESTHSEEPESHIDPLENKIEKAKQLHKEFYELSRMVRSRKAYTLDHALALIYRFCDRFGYKNPEAPSGKKGLRRQIPQINMDVTTERHHNQVIITFHPFPIPKELEGQLPDRCPGWRLYSPKEEMCRKCPHQKACFYAQVVPEDNRITQMNYMDYRTEQIKERKNPGSRLFRRVRRNIRKTMYKKVVQQSLRQSFLSVLCQYEPLPTAELDQKVKVKTLAHQTAIQEMREVLLEEGVLLREKSGNQYLWSLFSPDRSLL